MARHGILTALLLWLQIFWNMMLSHWESGFDVSNTPHSFRTPGTTHPAAQLNVPDDMKLENALCWTQ
jgi:hypothetical protein